MQEEQALLPRLSQAQQALFNDVHAMTPGLASLRRQQAALDAMTAQRDGEEQERAERVDAVDESLAAGNVHKHLKTYNLSIFPPTISTIMSSSFKQLKLFNSSQIDCS